MWFRKDLRLHDNPALAAACKADHILPVWILPQRELEPNPLLRGVLGSDAPAKMGPGRQWYQQSALNDLQDSLRSKRLGLVVQHGHPAALITALCEAYGITDVYTTELPGTEEIDDLDAVEQALESMQIRLHVYESHTLYHPEDLPFPLEAMPDVFTPFRKKIEKYAEIRDETPIVTSFPAFPEFTGTDDRLRLDHLLKDHIELPGAGQVYHYKSAMPAEGGEQSALKHLQRYIWDDQRIRTYKETRNGLIGKEYSSKFSGWLAVGALSARHIYRHVKLFEQQVTSNESTYWLIFELLWRDFFQFLMLKYEGQLFTLSGIGNEPAVLLPAGDGLAAADNDFGVGRSGRQSDQTRDVFGFHRDADALRQWIQGRTSSDFVNANMVELKMTGFMSNRGRQNVASWLAKSATIDWRWGAAWFESHLHDYDVASNWGNWAYVSGVGTDPRNRVFNVERQAEMYDAKGAYRRRWMDEL